MEEEETREEERLDDQRKEIGAVVRRSVPLISAHFRRERRPGKEENLFTFNT